MAIDMSRNVGLRHKQPAKASIDYYLIAGVCFLVFLVAAIIERLMPWNWLRPAKNGQRGSIVARSWDAAKTCTIYAFMG